MVTDPLYGRKQQLHRLYGLTWEGFQEMIRKQNYTCAICPSSISSDSRDTCVDHDHETDKVRGILCNSCNTGLGRFKDSIRLLASAIVYLEEHGKKYGN